MSLLGRSIELPEPFEKMVTEQFSERIELEPETHSLMERFWSNRAVGSTISVVIL
ncbi:MAG: hypothetical protein PHG00_00310 [Methylococcales bacterium]|nr:hypothetical protein [Methylococcales bacterium]